LLARGHRAAGRLLAITERGVEDTDVVGHGFLSCCSSVENSPFPMRRRRRGQRAAVGEPQFGDAMRLARIPVRRAAPSLSARDREKRYFLAEADSFSQLMLARRRLPTSSIG